MDGEMMALIWDTIWRLGVLFGLFWIGDGVEDLAEECRRHQRSHADHEAITKRSRGGRQ